MSETQAAGQQLPRNLMLGISFAQGVALFLLWRALENQVWPSAVPAINFPLWAFVLVWPTLLLLCLETGNLHRCLKAVSLLAGLVVLVAVYIGRQASPAGEFSIESLVGIFCTTTVIACFNGLMFSQQWIGRARRTYDDLFTRSWRNFLVVALAIAMTLGVAAILFIWGALFSLIGIEFFQEVFSEEWFLFPVLTIAFGLGVHIFRRLVHVIDGITSLLEGLMRLLLPLVVSVMVLFLGALPFTGLAPLWETGTGTALLLWLNAITLFFINAVYQTGRRLPYPPVVHNVLSWAIALLPAVGAVALYGLYLRIDEYGWTIARFWALTVFLILALFSGGYAWCIGRRRAAWPQDLGRVNTAMAWFLLALLLLVNSPLLDYRKISLASRSGSEWKPGRSTCATLTSTTQPGISPGPDTCGCRRCSTNSARPTSGLRRPSRSGRDRPRRTTGLTSCGTGWCIGPGPFRFHPACAKPCATRTRNPPCGTARANRCRASSAT